MTDVVGIWVDQESFDQIVEERWAKEKGITHCSLHSTYFALEEEPCWQCYEEFQYYCAESGVWICSGCRENKHKANEESAPFCSSHYCDCVCAG